MLCQAFFMLLRAYFIGTEIFLFLWYLEDNFFFRTNGAMKSAKIA